VNYLAHLLLAEPDAEGLLGALLGDFVKGPVPADLPAPVARGIRLHRGIDVFTDAHPAHGDSRRRFAGPRRRFAGVVVDLCYDHFLARDWEAHAGVPLDTFAREVYAVLEDRHEQLPPRLRRMAPHMIEEDWLGSYREIGSVSLALDRLARRGDRFACLAGALPQILETYEGLDGDFGRFFPDLRAHASALESALADDASAPAATVESARRPVSNGRLRPGAPGAGAAEAGHGRD
jgi:acyl carrier protein phosphodiesterase